MTIIYRKGNMFAHDFSADSVSLQAFMHGCNKQGVMGSGIAKEFKKLYPHAFAQYKLDIAKGLRLGEYSLAKTNIGDKKVHLVSAITQEFYGKDKKQYASYAAIEIIMSQTLTLFDVVVMPKIGCGLGGCDWGAVEAIIDKWLPEGNKVYVYSL